MIFENLAYFLNSSSSIMKNSKEFEAESKKDAAGSDI